MPSWDALKKKMPNGASTRSTRSRISSPHPGPNANGNGNGNGPLEPSKNAANEGGKTALDLWLEPKVQSRPSYEDHGLVRHGVLENMRSLDDLPRPASALQKRREAAAAGTQPVRKIILRTSNAARPASSSPAPVTPTTTAAPTPAATKDSPAGAQRPHHRKESEQQEDKSRVQAVKVEADAGGPDAETENSAARRALPGGRTAADAEDAREPEAGAHRAAPTTRTPLPGPRRSLPRTSTSRRTSLAGDKPGLSDSTTTTPASAAGPASASAAPTAAAVPSTPVTTTNASFVHSVPQSHLHSLAQPQVQPQVQPPQQQPHSHPHSQQQQQRQQQPHAQGHPQPNTQPLQLHQEILTPEHQRSSDKLNIDRIVEAAVDDALNHHRYPTAWALRTLYDEKSPDPRFLALFESVLTQTAEPDALREFAALLRAAKKEGKKQNQAWYYYGSTLPFPSAKPSPWTAKVTLDLAIVRERPVIAAPATDDAPAPDPASVSASAQELAPATPAQPEKKSSHPTPGIAAADPAKAKEVAAQPEPIPAPTPIALDAPPPELLGLETPSKRKRRPRKHRRSGDAMDLDEPPTTPGSRRRAASDSSGLSELEQSPSLPSPTPIARRDALMLDAVVADAVVDEKDDQSDDDETAPNDLRPIQRRSGTARQQAASADTSQPTSPRAPAASTRDSTTTATTTSMPGRVSPPVFPNPPRGKARGGRGSRGRGRGRGRGRIARAVDEHQHQHHQPEPVAAAVASDTEFEDDATIAARKRNARALTASQTSRVESFIRPSPTDDTDDSNSGGTQSKSAKKSASTPAAAAAAETPAASARHRKTRNSVVGTAAPGSSRVTRSGKRPIDEVEGIASSPIAPTFPADAASGSSSRAATPSLKPAAKKQRRNGPRVKSSPVKRKGGTAAGLPRPNNTEASSSFVIGMDENDEVCSACGGVGDLVCCEECPRSFHFDCADLDVTADLPDEWLCRICTTRKNPPTPVGPRGGFTSLINQLDRVNNQSFKLPQDVQNLFEGVRAGPEGDYESFDPNAPPVPPKPKRRGVVDDGPDFFPVRDAEDRAVLCHNCQAPTSGDRAVIPCSVCGLHWHLDCVDPPLAIPPVLRTWVCPAHPGDLLENQPGGLGPAHRFRKIKGAPIIDAEYTRGMKNNGFIEIYNDGPPEEDSGWRHMDTYGRVHRVPQSGIILDFINCVHKSNAEEQGAQSTHSGTAQALEALASAASETQPTTQLSTQHLLTARPIQEAQTALNLVALSGGNESSGLDMLTEALLTNADQPILDLMARGSADNLASGNISTLDAQSLRAMKAQLAALTEAVDARLQLAPDSEPAAPTGTASPKAAKTDVAEHDLPTPATIAADSGDMNNGMLGKSSPANDSAMDLD